MKCPWATGKCIDYHCHAVTCVARPAAVGDRKPNKQQKTLAATRVHEDKFQNILDGIISHEWRV
ncbi:MAG TPA: hypothetical protein VGL27_09385 [Negativicutes bacterium]|jgi:hypothetical protein